MSHDTHGAVQAFEGVLDEIEDYLENRQDIVDGSHGEQRPNAAMSLLTELRWWRGPAMNAMRSEKASMIPLEPTPAMIEAGAQRLVRWETGKEKWPESWNWIEVRAARQEAERVWRSMWLEAKDSPCTSGAQALSGRGADEAEMAPIGLEGDRVAVTGTRTTALSAELCGIAPERIAVAKMIEFGRLSIRAGVGLGQQVQRDLTDDEEELICRALRNDWAGYAPSATAATSSGWWCTHCHMPVPPEEVTFNETHDPRAGGCGERVGSVTLPVNSSDRSSQ